MVHVLRSPDARRAAKRKRRGAVVGNEFLHGLSHVGMASGIGLWIGMSSFSGLVTNFMSDAATVALIGPIVVPMGVMTEVAGEPWAVGLAVALASSYAHFLVVGSPANALTFALGRYPDTGERVLEAVDFIKYGFGFFILSMLLLWVVEFLLVFPLVGFPEGLLERATQVLQSSAG